MRYYRYSKGITLVELFVVILIVGILAAIAVPVYTNYMVRARRADAKTVLEQVRAAQEMWRAERGSYAINDGNGTAVAKLVNTMGVPPSPVGRLCLGLYCVWLPLHLLHRQHQIPQGRRRMGGYTSIRTGQREANNPRSLSTPIRIPGQIGPNRFLLEC